MKNWTLIFLVLFFSCKEGKKNKGRLEYNKTTFVQLKLSENLPFKEIKLQKFDPVYGSYFPINIQRSKENGFFDFRLNINEPILLHLADENNIGAGYIFLEPGENFAAEIFWDKQSIKKKIIKGEYEGDNILYQSILDSIIQLLKETDNNPQNFKQRESIDKYVERRFDQKVTSWLSHYPDLKISKIFYNSILNPQFEILKCDLKNKLIKRAGKENDWKFFFADSVFLHPDYKFWCYDFWEYSYFQKYLYEVINNSNAGDLRKYEENIEKIYSNKKDTLLLKIALSQGLISFSEKHSFDYSDNFLSIVLDSICKSNNLDSRRYSFPGFNLANAKRLELGVLNRITLAPLKTSAKVTLADVLDDTSKVYYVDYWASWCKPCIKGLPYTKNLYVRKYKNLEVLFLSIDHNVNNFIKAAHRIDLPITQTYKIIINDNNLIDYKSLNPIDQIPVYQLIFFHQGAWRIVNAFSSEDHLILQQINSLIQFITIN